MKPIFHAVAEEKQGFTLVEMLVVLTILGLTAAFAVPSIAKLSQPSASKVAQQVLHQAQLTRITSLRDGKKHSLVFDLNAGTVRSDAAADIVHVPSGISIAVTYGVTDQERDTNGRITFFPDGRSTGGVVRVLRQDEAVAVSVNWLTGIANLAEEKR